MQVLVADNDFTSRVPMETLLRERGHLVKGADDGLAAAKLLAGADAPRLAVLGQALDRLRGLDVCRFLSATGKKGGVYVILVCDKVDADLVERAKRAGVDDIVCRDFSPAMLAVRLSAALRSIELEDAVNRLYGALASLGAVGNPVQIRADQLREWNAGLLNTAKAPGASRRSAGAKAAVAKTPAVAETLRSEIPAQSGIDAPAPVLPEGPDLAVASPVSVVASVPEWKSTGSLAEQASAIAQVEQIQQAELAEAEEDPVIFPFEFDDIILAVFSGMGVTLKSQIPAKRVEDTPVCLSWVGIAMPARNSWVDILIESTEAGALSMAQAILSQEDVAGDEVKELWAELSNMLQGGLRRYLEESGKPALQLAIPKARLESQPPDLPVPCVESGFMYEGEAVNVLLFEHREFRTCNDAGDAQLFDLLCEPVILADGAPLSGLGEGCVLNKEQVQRLAALRGQTKSFKVIKPSKVARKLETSTLF